MLLQDIAGIMKQNWTSSRSDDSCIAYSYDTLLCPFLYFILSLLCHSQGSIDSCPTERRAIDIGMHR